MFMEETLTTFELSVHQHEVQCCGVATTDLHAICTYLVIVQPCRRIDEFARAQVPRRNLSGPVRASIANSNF